MESSPIPLNTKFKVSVVTLVVNPVVLTSVITLGVDVVTSILL